MVACMPYTIEICYDRNSAKMATFNILANQEAEFQLSFIVEYSEILDFDWLWINVAMVVASEWQVAIDVNFYEMGLGNGKYLCVCVCVCAEQ